MLGGYNVCKSPQLGQHQFDRRQQRDFDAWTHYDIVSHDSISSRLEAFGWEVVEIDGHNVTKVHESIKNQKISRNGKPKAIVANTKKGFGIPELENQPLCHITNPKPETIDQILGAAT